MERSKRERRTYEYEAAIQLALPGPVSRPSAWLSVRPPLRVRKLEMN